jgi:hypothetical protein
MATNDLAAPAFTPTTVPGRTVTLPSGRPLTRPATGTGAPGTGTPAPGGTGTGTPATPPGSAQSAWDAFRNSTNYKFRLSEGQDALTSMWAAHGALDSGAASKAMVEFSQNFAANELSNYMNILASQQAAGLSAAGAAMGVGTSYAGNVASQNTAAANAAANAALVNGQGQAGMWGAIGNGFGQIGGALTQYGMGQMAQPSVNWGAMTQAQMAQEVPVNISGGGALSYLPGGFA